MPPKGKKKRLPPPDVLSNLPDSVIDDILTRLPLQDVVRTSILSKKWRYNWRRVPQLKLDQMLWRTREDLISPTIGLTNIVYHLLAVHTDPITKFTLDIPNLIKCPNIDLLIYFLNRNGIHHLVLKLPSEFFVEAGHDLVKIFESTPALESLCWKQHCVQMVHDGPDQAMPIRLSSALNCLKRLDISWITLGEFFEFSFVLWLIRSSPNLEEIEIKVCGDLDHLYFCEPVPQDVLDEIPASFTDMTFNRLRTVKFYNVTGVDAEMELIKVLLAKSVALVKMVIEPCEMEDKESFKVLAEITKFQRASSKAEVVYSVD